MTTTPVRSARWPHLTSITVLTIFLTACGGSSGGTSPEADAQAADSKTYTVKASASDGGSVSPSTATVREGNKARFTVTADSGFTVTGVTGCGGSLEEGTYSTGVVTSSCTVTANFAQVPTISIADATVEEGDGATTELVFAVSMSGPANGNVTVDYTSADQTAWSGHDYGAVDETLTIFAGNTTATIAVEVTGDTTPEADETLTLMLTGVSANAALGDAEAVGVIVNDDVPGALNDTGVTTCATDTSGGLPCPIASHEGQDGDYGRDVDFNDNADGHAGFSFTKLGRDGRPLAIQDAAWDAGGDEATGTRWSCVQDNVTGLTWEVKTDDAGLHDRDWTYSWYSPDVEANGGSEGSTNGGTCVDAENCDTEKFVTEVERNGLCGGGGWRLPTVRELVSLVDNNTAPPGPTIDTAFFPNTSGTSYWAATPYAQYASDAWVVYFDKGNAREAAKWHGLRVRLVRSDQ